MFYFADYVGRLSTRRPHREGSAYVNKFTRERPRPAPIGNIPSRFLPRCLKSGSFPRLRDLFPSFRCGIQIISSFRFHGRSYDDKNYDRGAQLSLSTPLVSSPLTITPAGMGLGVLNTNSETHVPGTVIVDDLYARVEDRTGNLKHATGRMLPTFICLLTH